MLFRAFYTGCLCFVLVLSSKDLLPNRQFRNCPEIGKLISKSDLTKFLEALHRVIDFSADHINDIDINFYFGLFLANVNMKHALIEKYQALPMKSHMYIKTIIAKTDYLLEYFKYTTEIDNNPQNNKYKAIFSLFLNETTWIKRLPRFHLSCLNEKAFSNLNLKFPKWAFYKKYIDDRKAWIPNPHQSDLCLASLASFKDGQSVCPRKCKVLELCYDMVKNGTDFGYALAHRLLFLQQAAFARCCTIFSEQQDKHMSQRFCTMALHEVEYIVLHNFEAIDLLLEHVCLCALEGHALFLNRHWLINILRYQTAAGCFAITRTKDHNISARSRSATTRADENDDHVTMDGYCNGHTTALAAGTLAMASRFIVQVYY